MPGHAKIYNTYFTIGDVISAKFGINLGYHKAHIRKPFNSLEVLGVGNSTISFILSGSKYRPVWVT